MKWAARIYLLSLTATVILTASAVAETMLSVDVPAEVMSGGPNGVIWLLFAWASMATAGMVSMHRAYVGLLKERSSEFKEIVVLLKDARDVIQRNNDALARFAAAHSGAVSALHR